MPLYNANLNEMTFPAGILQPPFFDPALNAAVNYGGIGAVIGHEMIHGFDDEGRKYDGMGVLTSWWTDADATEFNARAAVLAGNSTPTSRFRVPPERRPHMGEKSPISAERWSPSTPITIPCAASRRRCSTADRRPAFLLRLRQSWRHKSTDDSIRSSSCPTRMRRRTTASTAWCGTWMPGTKRSIEASDKLFLAPENRARIC